MMFIVNFSFAQDTPKYQNGNRILIKTKTNLHESINSNKSKKIRYLKKPHAIATIYKYKDGWYYVGYYRNGKYLKYGCIFKYNIISSNPST